ncbi:MAG: hypothetical protein EDR02_12755 [Actinobacteria bacterium]|nr:MAG: hypothetical protein EDR02_12755 [Actinomycetota bacterium]RIK04632.1 MAG: hypothetical protein DCC48_13065 [Acidobacteriota bacterium]
MELEHVRVDGVDMTGPNTVSFNYAADRRRRAVVNESGAYWEVLDSPSGRSTARNWRLRDKRERDAALALLHRWEQKHTPLTLTIPPPVLSDGLSHIEFEEPAEAEAPDQ